MPKTTKKHARKAKVTVNNLGVGIYVALSLVVYVCVYFFLSSALKVVIPAFMIDSMMTQIELIGTAILMTTFMSFGVIMFLTKSAINRVIKVACVTIMASAFIYLYSLLMSMLS